MRTSSLCSHRAFLCCAAVRFVAILSVAIGVYCAPTYAQEQNKAIIVGTITDKSGAVIVSAAITIRDMGTNATYLVKTDINGFYTSPPLQIGTYTVTAGKKGFQTMTEPNIVLDLGTRPEINFTMVPGSVDIEVTIEAVSPALNTTSGTLGYVVDQRTIEDMPLNGGNVLSLAALIPGVVSAYGAAPSGFNDRGVQLSSIRIGGGAVGAYNITMDGANNQITYLGEVAINPQADAVGQYRLYSGTTPAQFGFTSGGAIDMASRSGTDIFHGTIYEYFRNDAMDAQGYFADTRHKPELRYNRFGGSFGGPAIHDKMFFFANAERYELIQTGPSYTTVPTALERQGDFSQSHVPYTITTQGCTPTASNNYCQVTQCVPVGIVDPANGRTIIPNSKIPANALDQSALGLQNAYYPLPNNSQYPYNSDGCSGQNNYVGSAKLLSHQQSIMGRIDYQKDSRNGFFLRYAYYSFYSNGNTIFPDPVAGSLITKPTNQVASLGYTRVIAPTIVNELRVSGLRAKFTFLPGSYGLNLPEKFGIQNIPSTTLPQIYNGMVGFSTNSGYRSATQFQIVDTVTKQSGSHGLLMGVDLRFNQAENNQAQQPSGSFSFAQNTTSSTDICFHGTSAGDIPCVGNIYASYLLGAVGFAQFTAVLPATFRSSSVSGYVQDDWRAAKGLTLNIGLRYDYQQQPFEIRNRTSNFDLTRGDPANGFYGETVYAGTGGYGRTFNHENYFDISPRFGFAWNVPHSDSTILRGGYSVYYSSTANISFTAPTNGFSTTVTSYVPVTTNGVALYLESGFPSPPAQNQGAGAGPDVFLGTGTVAYQEPNQRTPISQVFTVSLSRMLPSKFVLDVSYLGNNGVHFVQPNYNLNAPNPSYFATFQGTWPDPLQKQVPNPYAGLIPGNLGTATITQYNLDRPYPYYPNVADYQPRNGRYFGNFMYVSLQRRMANGFQLNAAYTLGKLLSDPIYVPISTSGGGINTGASSSFQNPRDRTPEHTIDTLDVTHRLTVSVLERLPFGRGQKFLAHHSVASALLSNVNLNAIVTLQGGTPLAISGANNYVATRPSYSGVDPHSDCSPAGGGKITAHTAQCWFNPSAFTNPSNYQFGNVPRVISSLRGPGAINVDASMLKTFKITKKYSAEFRFEGFNIFNHTNFSNPNTTFTANLNQGPPNLTSTSPPTTNPSYSGGNTNGNLGKISSAAPPRILQAGLKLRF